MEYCSKFFYINVSTFLQMGKRQISFFVETSLWKKFHVKCAEKDTTKTEILTEAVRKFLEK